MPDSRRHSSQRESAGGERGSVLPLAAREQPDQRVEQRAHGRGFLSKRIAQRDHHINWLYTPPDKNWFPWFRFYCPEKAVLDKGWKMSDIELVKQ